MSDEAPTVHDSWQEQLLADGNDPWLERALKSLDPSFLLKLFLRHFPAYHKDITILAGKPSRQVTAADIIIRREKIRERAPIVLESLVRTWVNIHADIGAEDASPEALAVMAWLHVQDDEPAPPTWAFVQHLAEQRAEDMARAAELASIVQELQQGREQQREDEMSARLAAERQKLREAKEQVNQRTQALKVKENEVASLRRNLEAYRAELAELKRTHEKALEARQRELSLVQERASRHQAQAQTEKRKQAELEDSSRTLTLELMETIEERDDARRQLALLQRELASTERKARQQPAALDANVLATSLVIDYEALGTEPKERLTLLLDLYEASLDKRPHAALDKTNWHGLVRGEYKGILLLGLETLLLDAVQLPLRRFLAMQSFSREALLHSLFRKLESPRLQG